MKSYNLGILILLVCLLLQGCSNFIYYPSRLEYFSPERDLAKLKKEPDNPFEDISFLSYDGLMLSGWKINRKSGTPARGKVLQAHGNAENMTSHFYSMYWLTLEGYDVYTFDYRGYGKSEGVPRFPDTARDTRSFIDLVRAENPELPLFVVGQSLGGSMATIALTDGGDNSGVHGLILDSTFSDYQSVAFDILGRTFIGSLFAPTTAWMLPGDNYSSALRIKTIGIPVMVAHGINDAAISFSDGEKLFAAASEPKEFYRMRGGHNDSIYLYRDEYKSAVDNFISNLA